MPKSKKSGWFDQAVSSGVEEIQRVLRIRGKSYGDSWASPRGFYTLHTIWNLKKHVLAYCIKRTMIPAPVMRAILLGAILDIKEARLPFAFEFLEDTPDDTVNYILGWKQAMREALLL